MSRAALQWEWSAHEASAQALLEAAPDAVVVVDERGLIVLVNGQAERMFGYDRQELLGASVEQLLPDALRMTHVEHRKRYMASPHIRPMGTELDTMARDRSGRTFPVEIALSPFEAGDEQLVIAIIRDVTEYRRMKATIRERNQLLASISDNITEAIYRSTPDNGLVYVNRAFVEMFGYETEEEVTHVPTRVLYADPSDRDRLQEILERQGSIRNEEIAFRRRDGTTFWGLVNAVVVHDEDGRPQYYDGAINDVTERKKAEEALALSGRRLAEAQRIARLGIWEWDIRRKTLHWSDEVFRIFGLEPSEFGATYEAFLASVHPDDRSYVQGAVERALSEQCPYDIEHRIRLPDGEERIVHERAEVICDDAGHPVRMVGTVQDITDRKRAEEALRQSEERWRKLVEANPEAIKITVDGRIVYINDAGVAIYGARSRDELLGRSVYDFVSSVVCESLRERHDALQRGEPTEAFEHEIVGLDGSRRYVEVFSIPIVYKDEPAAQTVMRDVTARKRYEQALEEAKREAEEMSRLKSAFLANMSHEIRTPLTSILGFAEILSTDLPDEYRPFAEHIQGSSRRLLETLNSVLDLAQLESKSMQFTPEPIDLVGEIRDAVRLFETQVQAKDLQLIVELPDEPVSVMLDSRVFHRIVNNLLSNAIKFTDKGRITVSVETDERHAVVHVQDTGIGISPEFMPYLFDAFKQESTGLKRSYEGSGLGLTITKRLVDLSGGQITVESEKGKGATFSVRFHRHEGGQTRASSDTSARIRSEVFARARILLVDDNSDTRLLVRHMLPSTCIVDTAADAAEALRLGRSRAYDAFLLDVNLGTGPTGVDLLRDLRAMSVHASTPAVAITAYALPEDEQRFLEEGFDYYVSKPFTRDDLVGVLARALRHIGNVSHFE